MTIAEIIALIGLALGSLSGLRALLQPQWIADVLKLQADPGRPGGYAEFRASFGGLFLLMHLFGIFMMVSDGGFHGAIVAATISMGWWGAAIGRTISLVADNAQNGEGGINKIWIFLEIVIGSMLLAPMIAVHMTMAG